VGPSHLRDRAYQLIVHVHSLKTIGPAKQETARLEVENAEDDLVQKTEVAIQLMKTVLDNVRDPFVLLSRSIPTVP
jgi:hypothetical protein